MTDNTVTFTAKDYKNQGRWKEVTITGEEFMTILRSSPLELEEITPDWE